MFVFVVTIIIIYYYSIATKLCTMYTNKIIGYSVPNSRYT